MNVTGPAAHPQASHGGVLPRPVWWRLPRRLIWCLWNPANLPPPNPDARKSVARNPAAPPPAPRETDPNAATSHAVTSPVRG